LPFVLLGLVEIAISYGSVYLAVYFRFKGDLQGDETIQSLWLQAALYSGILLLSMIASGLYQARLREGIIGFLLRLVASYLLAIVALSFLFYFIPDLFFGRGVLILAVLVSFVLIGGVRATVYYTEPDIFKRRVLVLGAGKRASALTELRRKTDRFGFRILGFVHLSGEQDVVPNERVLNLDQPLRDFVVRNDVDEIVLAVDDRRKGIPMHDLLDCKMQGVDVVDVITFFERETGKIRLDQLHPSWLVFSAGFKRSPFRDALKRGFDVLASAFLLSITWPFILITAIAILSESGFKPGTPILFRQVRIGQDGRPYQVLKFRSMVVDAEKGGKAQWATKNDPRVTRTGAFIRKTRIDELPQIFNVFRGDMSFVGPRPERPEFVVMLSDKIPYYAERHRVKPGITGWAQLLYPYGASEKDALEKLQYDLYYVKNHSVFLDFLILLQTAEVVLFGKGAR
jgi:sugar transferase (PEP-CTERM system associated)